MKKRIFAAVMAAILLTGCGGTSSSDPASKPAATASESVSSKNESASESGPAESMETGNSESMPVDSEGTGDAESMPVDPVETESSEKTSADEVSFPSFSAKDLEGNEVTEKIFADAKLTFVNVWGTFCGPCIQEMPYLGELAREYADAGVQFLGVVCDVADFSGSFYPGQPGEAREIIEATGAAYTHIILPAEFEEILSGAYMVPTTYLVDSRGRVLGEPYVGSRAKEEWKSIIDEKLAGL